MYNFFFDTADIDYIKNLWSKIGTPELSKSVKGITTNPNAMAKIGRHTLEEWQAILPKLCELVSEIRGDARGEVHVQAPNSEMTGDEVYSFAKFISRFSDGNTKLGLKIAPKLNVLKEVDFIKEYMPVNVTGLSDCSTAISCIAYNVDYVSIIPGRMEEVGIDADQHLSYISRRNGIGEVITGSMRTIEGLKKAVKEDTVPTIGTRVWDIVLNEDVDISSFEVNPTPPSMFSPAVTDKNTELSVSFFKQMDELGQKAYEDFKKTY